MVSIHAVNTIQFLKDLPTKITIKELIIILNTSSKLIDNKSIHPLSERYKSLNIYLNSNKEELIKVLENYGKNKNFTMNIRKEVINNIMSKASGKKTKNRKIKKKQTKRRSIKKQTKKKEEKNLK